MAAFLVVALCLVPRAASARDIDRDILKKGISLTEAVDKLGQPDSMEWVNAKGTAVLFLFYQCDDHSFFKLQFSAPIAGDTIKDQNGQTVLPMGFVTEHLAGWGKKFYNDQKSSQ